MLPFFFPYRSSIPPAKMHSGAMKEISSAIRMLVMVVPTLEPMITAVACARSIIPALTRPITMTVAAAEL